MKISQIVESSTTAGSIATVESPMGTTQSRMSKPPKSPKVDKQKKKFANQLSESEKTTVNEVDLSEQDVIVVPGMRRKKDKSFIPHKEDRRDHEVEMARSDVFAAAKDAMRIFKLLKSRSEDEGIMGWQQSYITLAADYLNSVADDMEYQSHMNEMTGGVIAGGMSNFEESTQKVDSLVTDALKIMKSPEMQDAVKALKTVLGHREYNSRPRFYQFYVQQLMDMYDKQDINEISDFKRKELERELAHEKNNYAVAIDGRVWKVFADERQATNIARSLQRKGKKASVHLTGASPTSESLDEVLDTPEKQEDYIKNARKSADDLSAAGKHKKATDRMLNVIGAQSKQISQKAKQVGKTIADIKEEKCPHCGGEMVSEELMNEKKDACYYKVKSRYKVWPSAYASGALVKCRKKGASNWGKSKK